MWHYNSCEIVTIDRRLLEKDIESKKEAMSLLSSSSVFTLITWIHLGRIYATGKQNNKTDWKLHRMD